MDKQTTRSEKERVNIESFVGRQQHSNR
jgi:hypothetical protein